MTKLTAEAKMMRRTVEQILELGYFPTTSSEVDLRGLRLCNQISVSELLQVADQIMMRADLLRLTIEQLPSHEQTDAAKVIQGLDALSQKVGEVVRGFLSQTECSIDNN